MRWVGGPPPVPAIGPGGAWYVPGALRRSGPHAQGAGLRIAGAALVSGAIAVLPAACGGEDQFANEAKGAYPVDVVAAKFPARQQLDQNAFLRIGVRNRGKRPLPAMSVTITIGGKEGVESAQPFSIRDPQPGLSIPDRPVWILADTYPRIAGKPGPGGAQTSNDKTFDFGELKPGDSRVGVWKLGAVKAGAYKLRYRVDAGLGGAAEGRERRRRRGSDRQLRGADRLEAAADPGQLEGRDRPSAARAAAGVAAGRPAAVAVAVAVAGPTRMRPPERPTAARAPTRRRARFPPRAPAAPATDGAETPAGGRRRPTPCGGFAA